MAHDHTGHNHVAHSQGHSHVPAITSLNKAFVTGIVLNLALCDYPGDHRAENKFLIIAF